MMISRLIGRGVPFVVAVTAILPILLGRAARPAAAQPPRPKPRFVLNSGGPVNVVHRLRFSADSRRLYAAGADKVVYAWQVREFAADRADLLLAQTLRWEVSRGPRGGVWALAVPQLEGDRRLALAGYGARNFLGDIVIYDTGQSQVQRALPATRPAGLGEPAVGHRQVIAAVDFSADGKQLASLSTDGELRVWSGPGWTSRVFRAGDQRTYERLEARFLDARYLAVSYPHTPDQGETSWWVAVYDTAGQQKPFVLSKRHPGGVTALARDAGSANWATADGEGNVYLWQGAADPRMQPQVLPLADAVAEDLAFGPRNTLLVATRLDDRNQRDARLQLWDFTNRRRLDEVKTSGQETNFACAVSPDGRWVATCGDNATPIFVFRLTDGNGRLLPRPLSANPAARVSGRGQRLGKIAFADDGSYRIGFGPAARSRFNEYGDVQRVFDPARTRLLPARPQDKWRRAEDAAWQIRAADSPRRKLAIYRQGQVWSRVELDPVTQGALRSYAWLKDAAGVFAVVLGTDHQNSIFVYDLRTAGASPLLRYYRDHTGWVTSLSVSGDGKYLASSSADGSVKLWSLAGLRGRDDLQRADAASFKRAVAWGATFAERNGQVVVASLEPSGIAASRGLRQDDVVVALNGQRRPADILSLLARNPLHRPLRLQTQGGTDVIVTPAWEPLGTLFVDRQAEWVLSTPQGLYDASIDGDELVGFQINKGPGVTPDFFRSDQFRDTLERPQVIRQLLSAGNLPRAMQLAAKLARFDLRQVVSRLTEDTPSIRIVSPSEGELVEAATTREPTVTLEVAIDFPSDQQAREAVLDVYLNGRPVSLPSSDVSVGKQRRARWQVGADLPYNAALVVVEGDSEETGKILSFKTVNFRAREQKLEPRLQILALAADQYRGDDQLLFPEVDAKSLVQALTARGHGLYQMDEQSIDELYNEQIAERLDATIEKIRRRFANPRPGDLLVVFVSGHGIVWNGKYYFVLPGEESFLQEGDLPELIQQKAARRNEDDAPRRPAPSPTRRPRISWEKLEQLSQLPCRKLVFLDTFHAGNGLLQQDPPAHMKAAIRTLNRKQFMVIAATEPHQYSYEPVGEGHSLFASCLLQGLRGKADRGNDGRVDVREIGDFVRQEVPELHKFYEETDVPQTPRISPGNLFFAAMTFVPLIEYSQAQP